MFAFVQMCVSTFPRLHMCDVELMRLLTASILFYPISGSTTFRHRPIGLEPSALDDEIPPYNPKITYLLFDLGLKTEAFIDGAKWSDEDWESLKKAFPDSNIQKDDGHVKFSIANGKLTQENPI